MSGAGIFPRIESELLKISPVSHPYQGCRVGAGAAAHYSESKTESPGHCTQSQSPSRRGYFLGLRSQSLSQNYSKLLMWWLQEDTLFIWTPIRTPQFLWGNIHGHPCPITWGILPHDPGASCLTASWWLALGKTPHLQSFSEITVHKRMK